MKKQKPKTCVECKIYKEEDGMGYCSKMRWEIMPDIAKRQAVCSEDDDLAEKIKMVTVLSPCGNRVLISKEAYEKEKDETEGWNFWRPLK